MGAVLLASCAPATMPQETPHAAACSKGAADYLSVNQVGDFCVKVDTRAPVNVVLAAPDALYIKQAKAGDAVSMRWVKGVEFTANDLTPVTGWKMSAGLVGEYLTGGAVPAWVPFVWISAANKP